MAHVQPKLTAKDLEDYSMIMEFRENPVYAAQLLLNRDYDPMQAIGLYGSWTTKFAMLDYGRGLGKCLAGKTLITTDKGLERLENLIPKTEKDESWHDVNFSVLTPHGMRSVKKAYSREITNTKKIKTRFYYDIEGSKWHKLLTMNTSGDLEWKKMADIIEGDFICINKNKDNNVWGNETDLSFALTDKRILLKYPDKLDEEFAKILGYLTGDGCLSVKGATSLYSADKKIEDEFISFCEKALFKKPCIYKRDDKKCVDMRVFNVEFKNYLTDLGFGPNKAHAKHIPDVIFKAPKNVVASFISGMFDTDGYADLSGYVSYTSVSIKLIKDLQLILLNFGILSSIRERLVKYKGGRNLAYELNIRSQHALKFYNEIGFGLERKQERSKRLAYVFNTNVEIIPHLEDHMHILHKFKDVRYGEGRDEEWEMVRKASCGRYEITDSRLSQILSYYEEFEKTLSYLKQLKELPFFYDEVVSVRDGEDYLYDIEVTSEEGDYLDHSYVANGIVSHNCVSGDTLIKLSNNQDARIKDLFNQQSKSNSWIPGEDWSVMDREILVKSYDTGNNILVDRPIESIFRQSITEELFKISLDNGLSVTSTAVHKFYSQIRGWIKARDIKINDILLYLNNEGKLVYNRVIAIDIMPCPEDGYVYDLSVPGYKNYVANNIVTHNTVLGSDMLILSGLLYPGTQSLVVSHSMKGAKLVFDELIKTHIRSRIVRDSTPKRPTKGNDVCEMLFNSTIEATGQQTIIKGVAADINNDGASIRGNRVSRCLYIDEWVYLPQELINGAVIPCASTTEDPTRPEYDLNNTRILFTSSSGYTYMEAYKRMETFRKFFLYPEKYAEEGAIDRNGRPQYFYHNLNYTKITKPGIINFDNIKMWKATFSVGKFNTEVMAQWESDSGSWYNAKELRGDPEDNSPDANKGIWINSSEEPDAKYLKSDKSGQYSYIVSMDPAERQDEAGLSLIRITPDKLYIADTEGYEGKTFGEIAEIIRGYMDRYDVVGIAIDPEGGGRAVVNDLKTTKVRHNTLTGKLEPFFPLYPVEDKWLNKGETIPAGARRWIHMTAFSSNANINNLTDMNITLRTVIAAKTLRVCKDGPGDFTERVMTLMEQIIGIEAVPISETKNKEAAKQAADKGRYKFTSRILKDRWAALLIGVHQAIITQAEMNIYEEEEDPGVLLLPSIYNSGDYDPYGGYSY